MTKPTYDLPEKTCAWFKCGKTFKPAHPSNVYCCPQCGVEMHRWRSSKGAQIMPAFVNFDAPKIAAFAAKIQKEIAGYIDKAGKNKA
jgi:predicted RNA-binding Zn-ribbon protein involved in translation (DUF1610 family)